VEVNPLINEPLITGRRVEKSATSAIVHDDYTLASPILFPEFESRLELGSAYLHPADSVVVSRDAMEGRVGQVFLFFQQ
jgi:hypothetical protein